MSRLEWLTNLFPLWVLITAIVALLHPPLFLWVSSDYIVWILMVVMLGMGLTLSWADFKAVGLMPRSVALGFLAQYLIMPTAGWLVARLYQLPPPFAVGLILVACCPGGTASNVVSFIARAHVALSVVMTLCSTLAAVVLTPLLKKLLAGQYVEVNYSQLKQGAFSSPAVSKPTASLWGGLQHPQSTVTSALNSRFWCPQYNYNLRQLKLLKELSSPH